MSWLRSAPYITADLNWLTQVLIGQVLIWTNNYKNLFDNKLQELSTKKTLFYK
jgi:hypothetical protein